MDEAGLQAEIGITLNKLNKQLAAAEARMNRTAQKIENQFKRPQKAIEKGFQQADKSASSFANGGLRNVSLQLSQVAQQGSATGDYVKALAIQLPDLALGFGTVGIAAGVLAGVLLPMASDFVNIGGETESLTDKLKNLETAVKSLQTAQAQFKTDPTSLLGDFGSLADEARIIFDINRQMAQIRAQSALDDTARGIAGELGVAEILGFDPAEIREIEDSIKRTKAELRDLESTPASTLSDEQLRAANLEIDALSEKLSNLRGAFKNLDDLADLLGINEDQAKEVVAQFAALGQADGARQQADIMVDLAEFIKTASNNLSDAEDEGKELYDQLIQAVLQALELSKVDVSSNLLEGADAAEQLKEELAAALELQNRVNSQSAKTYSGRGGDPRRVGNDDYTNELGYKSPEELIEEANRRSARARGSGRKREFDPLAAGNRQIAGLEQQISSIGKTTAAVATLTAKYQLLETAKRRGIDLDKVNLQTGTTLRQEITAQAEKIGELAEQYEVARSSGQHFSDVATGLSSGLSNLIFEGAALNDVLGNLARSLAAAAVEAGALAAVNSLFDAILPGFGSGSAPGASPGGVTPAILHDGGTVGRDGYGHGRSFAPSTWSGAPRYHNGGIAGLKPNEYPAILEGGEVVVPTKGLMSRSSRGGQELTVNVHNAPQGTTVRQSPDGRSLDIMIEERAIAAMTGPKGQRAMRDRYGVKPSVRGA